jgi:nucleotide-binding universal stress UspA family protein
MFNFDSYQHGLFEKRVSLSINPITMKKILVPCDFSAQSRNAFQTALSIAAAVSGEVHLLHVIEIPVLQDPLLMPIPAFEEGLFGELQDKAKDEYAKMVQEVPADQVVVTKVVYGVTSSMILDYARENHIDLIIMGTKGSSGIREMFVGSNTEKIVRQSPVPVLALKKDFKKDQIKKIVFPNSLDTEKQDNLVLQVKALQNFFDAKLHIVWINTPSNFAPDYKSQERLKTFVTRYMFSNCTTNIYNDLFEESGIVNFAHEVNADILVMGTHGRKGLSHIFAGSVTEDVVNHIDIPIWTLIAK